MTEAKKKEEPKPTLTQEESVQFRKMLSAMVMRRINDHTTREMMSECIRSNDQVRSIDELRQAVEEYRYPIEDQIISWVVERVKDLDNKAERGY